MLCICNQNNNSRLTTTPVKTHSLLMSAGMNLVVLQCYCMNKLDDDNVKALFSCNNVDDLFMELQAQP